MNFNEEQKRKEEERRRAIRRDGSEWEIGLGAGLLVLTLMADFFSGDIAPFQLGKLTIGYVLGAGALCYGLWNRYS